jgi:hypothetical protein
MGSSTALLEPCVVAGVTQGQRSSDPALDLQKRFAWLALSLAAFQAFCGRNSFSPDSLSYMDVGDAWLRGDFHHAINGYWNPLYAILLAIMSRCFGQYWQFVSNHLVNFILFMVLQRVFHLFLQELRGLIGRQFGPSLDQAKNLVLFGYPVFIWTSLSLMNVISVSPDILMASFALGTATCMLRIHNQGIHWKPYALAGILLGLGYLAKTVMFVLAFPFLIGLFFAGRPLHKGFLFASSAGIIFCCVCAPYIGALSHLKSRFTYGDAGALAYAWEVNRISPYFFWQGGPNGFGQAVHAPREISKDPPIYEFASVPTATYSLWFDPSYWHEGLRPRFNFHQQLEATAKALPVFLELAKDPFLVLFVFSLALAIFVIRAEFVKTLAGFWWLLLPALVPFALYSLVFAELRYIGVFLLILLEVFLAVALAAQGAFTTVLAKTFAVLSLAYLLFSLLQVDLKTAFGFNEKRFRSHLLTAQLLNSHGISRGDTVAVMGQGAWAGFARLAGVKVIAEASTFHSIPDWVENPAARHDVEAKLEALGVKALVLDTPVKALDTPAWISVKGGKMAIKFASGGH